MDIPSASRNVKDVTISLVSYNQRTDLERLFPSLLPAAKLSNAEIILVSNRSHDDTIDFVRLNFSEIKIINNPKISGYGANHNLSLSTASSRYFVIMNSDMQVESKVFIILRNFMDQNPDIGIVSPKILNENGTVQGLNKRYPTIYDLLLRRFLPKRFQQSFKYRLDYYEMRDIGYDLICDVPFISGSFMFCRTDLLKKVGGFDEKYFLYFEDVDLCRRVQNTHRTVYNPNSSVIHFWKRDAHNNWLFTYYFMRSAFLYFNRWGYKFI